jgi:hypothetical protein
MAEAKHHEGDPRLRELFEKFNAQMVSPGGAAALLGLSRKTIHTLGEQGEDPLGSSGGGGIRTHEAPYDA